MFEVPQNDGASAFLPKPPRVVDVIVAALKTLGGVAHLEEIEAQLELLDRRRPQHSIRGRLEEHSSDSDAWKSAEKKPPDLFYMFEKGTGIWGLRGFSVEHPDRYPIAELMDTRATLFPRSDTPLKNDSHGIIYRDDIVHAVQVGFAPGSPYPDKLLLDGRIEHVGEGTGPEQLATRGNRGMLEAIDHGYDIPVFLSIGKKNHKRYASLGNYRVISSRRQSIPLLEKDSTTDAFIFTLEPAARSYIQEAVITPGGPASLQDDADSDELPTESAIPDEAPKAPTTGEYASDPEARRQAHERSNTLHHALVLAMKRRALDAGLRVTRTRYADALVRTPAFGAIFEMKTVREDRRNLIRQVRAAIAQLYHYRFLHRKTRGFEHGTHLYAVFNATIPTELVSFLREIGIGTIWLTNAKFEADPLTDQELPWL